MKHRFFTAQFRELLSECLETELVITEQTFHGLIGSGIYKFYAYDRRISCNRYILVDMSNNLGLPAWIHEYIEGYRGRFKNDK